MPHQVLSRKYRPQRFTDLVGQEHVARILQNALASGRVGHAYLLVGPRGVGKTTTARIFARALNCEQRVPHDEIVEDTEPTEAFEPCGTCSSCVDIAAGSDLDVVEMDAASNNAVDDVRALREQVGYATVRSRYRIWIVDEVHMLSLPAFNAFLKTLEEPPPQVKFLFCTTEEHKLPDTFRSRCQRVEFRPIDDAAMAARLEELASREGVPLGPGLAKAIAHGALGGLRDAESQLEQLIAARPNGDPISVADLDALSGRAPADLLDALCAAVDARDAGAALDAVDACLGAGSKPGVLVDQWLERLREMLVQSVRAPSGGEPVGPGYARVARAVDVLLGKRAHLRAGADGGLVLQVAAVELARLPDARDLDALIAALRGEGGEAPAAPEPRPPAVSNAPRAPAAAPNPGVASAPARTPAPASTVAPAQTQTQTQSRERPPQPESLDVNRLRDAWPEIVRGAMRRSPPLGRALESAEPRELRGNAAIVALPQSRASARGTLLRREMQLAFGQVVREILGSFVKLEVRDVQRITPVTEPVGEDMRGHPAVQHVTEITGGRLLNIERRADDAPRERPGAT
ncbi:MAG: DNA polymerase III subunit gamma/tau [Planctomycetota bacterium]|nr:DNA polymerase III subunit gamma/tau [Planctomycetota bacterium]